MFLNCISGSVIKHQLVTHLTLGIALRGVLDALRKPPDSKMFVFGTKALEQFVDRLIEWPQYCNRILQISHLRGTHAELVAFIERALARISSRHLESNGINNDSVAYHHGLSQVASVNGEVRNRFFFFFWCLEFSNKINFQQAGQQLSSTFHLQQRHEGSLATPFNEPKQFASAAPFNETKQFLSSSGQSSIAPSSDVSSIQKSTITSSTLLSSLGFVRPSRGVTSTRFGSALNIETLMAAAERRETPIEAPGSEIQDKVSFMINNISAANVEAKAKEFTEILKEQYYPWFAQYMVMKRASIEPNFHDLYLKFLDKVNSKALNKEIVQDTYENCKVLLGSELIKSSSEERSLLKNLGSWLGRLTIGRNQVLRAREIDPKSLIIEAYEKGLMIAVIPFTSKVLEPCQNSLAYQPPNPWTMGILGLLAEIYSMLNLKMNLKFDIEVLFKNLGVDMKDIAPISLLKDRKREIEGNPDFSNKDVGASQPQMVPEVKSGIIPLNHVELPLEVASPPNSGVHTHMLSQYTSPVHLSSGTLMEDEKPASLGLSDQLPSAQGLFQATPSQSAFRASQLPTTISNIGTHVIINQKLNSWGLHVHFQRLVPAVMDRAIKDIVSVIVQRSVSIATQTTKELVLKDYAMESDETRIYNAAHLMVASLAGSLAHVTCKEPLCSSISSQLRNSVQGLSTSEILEHAVQLVTNDNLDLGCAVIEQAATDKAIQTIDMEIAQQLLRRKHRDGVGPAFFDANMYTQSSMGAIPEALRPKPGHLTVSQQRVYEDFVRLPWQNQSSQSSHVIPTGSASSCAIGPASAHGSVSLDVVSEAIESNSATHLSPASIHSMMADGFIQQGFEKISTSAFISATTSSELSQVKSSDVAKEAGVSSQPPSSLVAPECVGSSIAGASLNTRDVLDKYQIIAQKLGQIWCTESGYILLLISHLKWFQLETLVTSDSREAEIQVVVAEVPEIIIRCVSRDEAALAVAQKVFKGLYENASSSFHVNACLAILAAIRDVCKLVVKELTSWVIYSDEERKFNKDITLGLMRSELLNLAEYNVHMAKLIDGGRNRAATDFAVSLIQALVAEESNVISELHNFVDALPKLAAKPVSFGSLQQLIEIARNPGVNVAALTNIALGKEDKTRQSRDKPTNQLIANREEYSNIEPVEPDGFRKQVSMLFAEWCQICEHPGGNDAASTLYISKLQKNGLLKGNEMTDCFFHVLMELSVAHCLSSEVINSSGLQSPHQMQNLSFLVIDIYAKLLLSILKVEQGSSKPFPLSKILSITVKFIQKDSEVKKNSFNARPYFRLFISWLRDLLSPEPVGDGVHFQILTAFAGAFHNLQPLKVPGFSYVWLSLVSHRSFMPRLLIGNAQKGWPHVQRLLVDLFQFLEPYLRNAELAVPVHLQYKGTLRVLLVLLHDFPEFLCDFHFTFCDVIPPSCIQMRNIILSAFPLNMRLPDSSTPNLKIDLLPEIREPPHIISEVDAALKVKQMKTDVDEYLKTRQQGSSILAELKQRLLLSPSEAASSGTRYNVPLINSLVLYAGMQAIQQLQARTPHGQSTGNTAPLAVFLVDAALDIYQTLILDLDTEGRYLFLNAVSNQLRYPNNHTHYFSFVLLYLFAESNQGIIQEQITRVLLERLIVNRPHPWGLLITFIELIKNPRYNFWNRSFIRCAPEIEKLFESVARSCGGLKPMDESMISGWASESAH
ncbi:hypothetical protein SADUNF_Sadunf02G0120300 [Salix dunnii]|uniref:CCR4-NOT transcription complex subunit 1 n=1 Tax=Salix dunnii TaxID=1413687 RepID=A0A835N7R1_9ROSI|nr:hypothetical protein SADUNF_Sadunf02G0120300 [Salix dunnii]